MTTRNAKSKFLYLAAASLGIALGSFEANAQSSPGYWTDPAAGGAVWKSPFGLCWRASYWDSANATVECDPDLVPKPAAAPAPTPVPPPPVAPAPAPAPVPPLAVSPTPAPGPKPAPAPAPVAKPAPKPAALTIGAAELFGFNQATLTPQGRAKLDTEIVQRANREYTDIRVMNINGHTDRLGTPQYNQQLSERRAEAVRAYLVSRGMDNSKIETFGYGKTLPVKACPDQKNRKALIECLAPNRRVEIEINGTRR